MSFHDDVLSRRWFALAYTALVAAGAFAVAIVVARMPVLDRLMGDPMFFRRCLVVHVTLALCLWFYAFFASLYHVVPRPAGSRRLHRAALVVAWLGFASIMAGAGVRGAEPLLVNYLPMIDTPLFWGGLALFGVAVGLPLLDGRIVAPLTDDGTIDAAAQRGLRAGGVAFLLALATFATAVGATPEHLTSTARFEAIVWGGGHVLQFTSVLAMVAVWQLLLTSALGPDRRTEAASKLLFPLLLLPLLMAPVIASENTAGAAYRVFFTDLMRWGIFPAVLVFIGLGISRIRAAAPFPGCAAAHTDPRVIAFLVSATLTAVGFVIGALIRGQNTMIPAHYHASIGGVTVAFMGASFLLLERYGRLASSARVRWIARWQPVVYGVGQLTFVLGFGLAGANGMERKVYGAEQHIRGMGELIGLGAMGLGGFVAIAGGVMLLLVVLPSLLRSAQDAPAARGRMVWPVARIADTRSSG